MVLSFNTLNSSDNVFSLSFNIDVKSLPRQLNMVIGRKLFGSYLFPLFLNIGLMLVQETNQINEEINKYIDKNEILNCIKS
jgi:hypothetical protein